MKTGSRELRKGRIELVKTLGLNSAFLHHAKSVTCTQENKLSTFRCWLLPVLDQIKPIMKIHNFLDRLTGDNYPCNECEMLREHKGNKEIRVGHTNLMRKPKSRRTMGGRKEQVHYNNGDN